MTNMLHKSVEARRIRNGRYKAAINPVRVMFNCTAAQAAGKIAGVVNEVTRLTAELEKVEAENAGLKEQLNDYSDRIKADADRLESLQTNVAGLQLDVKQHCGDFNKAQDRVKELETQLEKTNNDKGVATLMAVTLQNELEITT